MREWLRIILVAVLIVMLIGFSFRVLRAVLALLVPAVAIVGLVVVIRHLLRRESRGRVEEIEPSGFERRHPRVARLEKRVRNLESVTVEDGGKR